MLMMNMNVSNETLRSGDVSGLWKLSVLTSSLSLIPLTLLWMLPRNAEDEEAFGQMTERSTIGGAVFLTVLLGSLSFSISQAVWELLVF
jgi:hypothetical protein